MAELHIQPKRSNFWWLWVLLILIIAAAAYYFYMKKYEHKDVLDNTFVPAISVSHSLNKLT